MYMVDDVCELYIDIDIYNHIRMNVMTLIYRLAVFSTTRMNLFNVVN